MDDIKSVVPKVDYKVNVKHTTAVNPLNSKTEFFSEVNSYFSNSKKEGTAVYCFHSLASINERLNNIVQTKSKHKSIALLKGLYSGGTSGMYCHTSAPFLFYDIDVSKEKKENLHLLEPCLNAEVFNRLKEISVLAWRSNSKNGMAGILYVPNLVNYTYKDSILHKKIGGAITDYLIESLCLDATFDNTQSKFRQLRYLAIQDDKRALNLKPYVFDFEVKEVQKVSVNNVPQFIYKDNRVIKGSLIEQFNKDTSINNALIDNGFTKVTDNRYKHFKTTSSTTGETSGNLFFNHSQSFSDYKVFTPFWLYYTQNYGYDFKAILKDLRKKGYKDIEPTNKDFKSAKTKLKSKVKDRVKQIFDACYNLRNATYKNRIKFASENANTESEKLYFFDYLNLKNLSIDYNKTLYIKNYVSEQIIQILNYSDINNKTLLCADTGTGKTTAFIKEFNNLRPYKKLLLLAPLTAIVEQLKAENSQVLCLTGNSTPDEHSKVKNSFIVVATYEQGAKYLNKNLFDYVVIDEAHNLISANSYKYEAIRELTKGLKNIKVIGLTGTPNNLFKQIGYKLLKIQKENSEQKEVNFRIDNRNILSVLKNHLSNTKGKSIFRFNSINTAEALKKTLVKDKTYKQDEILILNSSDSVKHSSDFQELSNASKFKDNIKIVFTTSIIDEGLSIKQQGFTDVVFIETEYNPNPEAFKQFIARFRNVDPNRKYYYYYKEVNDQFFKPFNIGYSYNKLKVEAKEYAKERGNSVYNKINNATYDNYLYSNNSINYYALAYSVNELYFKKLNTQEYINYIETNFSLKLNVCSEFEKAIQNNENEKNIILTQKQSIFNFWKSNNFEITSALREITNNKNVKKIIEYTGYKPKNLFYDIVSANKKTFEYIVITENELERLQVKDINTLLFSQDKLNDKQTINRALCLHRNLDTINNPKTKQDFKNAGKMKCFIDEVSKLQMFNNSILYKLWKKQRCNSINVKGYNLKDLVLQFYNYKEDKNTRFYHKINT